MGQNQITRSALSWLRETDTLTMMTLKRAYWEDIRPVDVSYGHVIVENHSHEHPDEHSNNVSVSQHGLVHHCDCSHYKYRNDVCKHMVSVAMEIDDGNLDLEEVGCFADVIARAEPQTQA